MVDCPLVLRLYFGGGAVVGEGEEDFIALNGGCGVKAITNHQNIFDMLGSVAALDQRPVIATLLVRVNSPMPWTPALGKMRLLVLP